MTEAVNKLLTGCPEAIYPLVEAYLQHPAPTDAMILDAWAACGRKDQGRTRDLEVTAIARQTMSPLGLACLIRYGRAWVIAAEEARDLATSVAGSSRSREALKKSEAQAQLLEES